MKISDWISDTSKRIEEAGIDSAHLDAELILAHVLGKSREWLLAHNDSLIEKEILGRIQDDIDRRVNREPLAYILGKKEFYGREFVVSPNVLIPRPESEQIIVELAKTLELHFKKAAPPATAGARKIGLSPMTIGRHPICASGNDVPGFSRSKILDIGTGSGALAITAALEFPFLQVTASDISNAAMGTARQNANKLGAKVTFLKSDLLNNIDEKFDIILANLPYVDKKWQASPETNHEPEIALFAANNGLDLIKKLIKQVPKNLNKNGFLILEMDSRQIKTIKKFAAEHNFQTVNEWPFGLVLKQPAEPNN
ncbi:peptide chain release factor N(5)-glutamine methyltransferase [Candidatus Saccharibacteria bacterium]|nr:peptide chain release factor N(5)-glutamine methyltransferase [Candidatus Saccharibacteria bacterium]